MIRMGRGNRDTTDEPQPTTPTRYDYPIDNTQPGTSRAISESDSMARDIKEGRLSGFVGHGTTLTGETEFHAMLRVDGHLVGTVSSEAGTLIIGTNGQVDANVAVAAAMVNGTVNGDIVATEKLQLGRTARVLGNIQCPRLIIEEGAILEGSCSMQKARETLEEESSAPAANAYQPTSSYQLSSEDSDVDAGDDDLDDSDLEDEESADAARV